MTGSVTAVDEARRCRRRRRAAGTTRNPSPNTALGRVLGERRAPRLGGVSAGSAASRRGERLSRPRLRASAACHAIADPRQVERERRASARAGSRTARARTRLTARRRRCRVVNDDAVWRGSCATVLSSAATAAVSDAPRGRDPGGELGQRRPQVARRRLARAGEVERAASGWAPAMIARRVAARPTTWPRARSASGHAGSRVIASGASPRSGIATRSVALERGEVGGVDEVEGGEPCLGERDPPRGRAGEDDVGRVAEVRRRPRLEPRLHLRAGSHASSTRWRRVARRRRRGRGASAARRCPAPRARRSCRSGSRRSTSRPSPRRPDAGCRRRTAGSTR